MIVGVQVFVVGFPPRLSADISLQNLLQQHYHRVSAQMGKSSFTVDVKHFDLCVHTNYSVSPF